MTEADAQRELCADVIRGRSASSSPQRENLNQRLLADAALFDKAGDHATAKGIRGLVEALRTLDRLRREKTQMAVFMEDGASQIEIDGVMQSLSQARGVVSVRFESKEDTYRRAREVFTDYPELIDSITPDDLPALFRVRVASSAAFDQVAATAEALLGVAQARIDVTETAVEAQAWVGLPALRKCLLPAIAPSSITP